MDGWSLIPPHPHAPPTTCYKCLGKNGDFEVGGNGGVETYRRGGERKAAANREIRGARGRRTRPRAQTTSLVRLILSHLNSLLMQDCQKGREGGREEKSPAVPVTFSQFRPSFQSPS